MKRKKDSVEDDETLQFTGKGIALVQLDIGYLSFFGSSCKLPKNLLALFFH